MNKFAKLLEKMEPNYRQWIWIMSEQWHVSGDRAWLEGVGYTDTPGDTAIFRISNRWESPFTGKPQWKLTKPDGAIVGDMADMLRWLGTHAMVRPPQ